MSVKHLERHPARLLSQHASGAYKRLVWFPGAEALPLAGTYLMV